MNHQKVPECLLVSITEVLYEALRKIIFRMTIENIHFAIVDSWGEHHFTYFK